MRYAKTNPVSSFEASSYEMHNQPAREKEPVQAVKNANDHGDAVVRAFVVEWQMQSFDQEVFTENSACDLEFVPYLH